MRRFLLFVFVFALACVGMEAQAKPENPLLPDPKVKVGQIAPDFTLLDQNRKEMKLSDFRGKKNVVVSFYVFAFSGGCEREMRAFQERIKDLEATDTQVLGVSMDSTFANDAFAKQIGVTFPLLSDRGGEITKEYGIYNPQYKAARRVTYLIDKQGKVVEMQIDKDAIDPTAIVTACKREKLKS